MECKKAEDLQCSRWVQTTASQHTLANLNLTQLSCLPLFSKPVGYFLESFRLLWQRWKLSWLWCGESDFRGAMLLSEMMLDDHRAWELTWPSCGVPPTISPCESKCAGKLQIQIGMFSAGPHLVLCLMRLWGVIGAKFILLKRLHLSSLQAGM